MPKDEPAGMVRSMPSKARRTGARAAPSSTGLGAGTLAAGDLGGGTSYAFRLAEELSAGVDDAVRAYAVSNAVFGLSELWAAARAADMPVALADRIVLESRRLLDRASRWFLTNRPQPLAVAAETARFATTVQDLSRRVGDMLQGPEAEAAGASAESLHADGVPRELARRAPELHANCFHPGVVRTGFGKNENGIWKILTTLGAPFFRSPARGARSLVWLALSEQAAGLTGEYVQDEKVISPSAQAQDDDLAQRLWERSAELVGLPLPEAPQPRA